MAAAASSSSESESRVKLAEDVLDGRTITASFARNLAEFNKGLAACEKLIPLLGE